MVWLSHELTDVVTCCTQSKRVIQIGTARALHKGRAQMASHLNRVCDRREMQHLRKCWLLLKEAQLEANPWQELSTFFADDLFGKGRTEMEQRVLARLTGKRFQVGSEEWNDVLFTRQRFRWMRHLQSGLSIEVNQE